MTYTEEELKGAREKAASIEGLRAFTDPKHPNNAKFKALVQSFAMRTYGKKGEEAKLLREMNFKEWCDRHK